MGGGRGGGVRGEFKEGICFPLKKAEKKSFLVPLRTGTLLGCDLRHGVRAAPGIAGLRGEEMKVITNSYREELKAKKRLCC